MQDYKQAAATLERHLEISVIGTDRIGVLAAGPDSAGFCRTGTGGFRVK